MKLSMLLIISAIVFCNLVPNKLIHGNFHSKLKKNTLKGTNHRPYTKKRKA